MNTFYWTEKHISWFYNCFEGMKKYLSTLVSKFLISPPLSLTCFFSHFFLSSQNSTGLSQKSESHTSKTSVLHSQGVVYHKVEMTLLQTTSYIGPLLVVYNTTIPDLDTSNTLQCSVWSLLAPFHLVFS